MAFPRPIFITAGRSIDITHRNWGPEEGKYTSKSRLLTSYVEKGDSTLKFAKRWAALDVWGRGLVLTAIDLQTARDAGIYIPATGSRYVLLGRDFPDQTGHNDYDVLEDQSTGFSLLVSGTEFISLLVFPVSHTYVHYTMSQRKSFPSRSA